MIIKPTWSPIIAAEMGTREFPGGRHNPKIIAYHRSTTLHDEAASKDETAWCGSFAAWTILEAGYEPPARAFRARSWIDWGLELPEPWPHCITVIKRNRGRHETTRSGWHVGFFGGLRSGVLLLDGGNQGNAVRRARFDLNSWEVYAFRYPIERAVSSNKSVYGFR
jgi:uncharacterized protein (TIGR02594 family)